MSIKSERFKNGLEWPVMIFMIVVHALALALCVLYPSWEGVAMFLIFYLITGLGVTVGYHRKLTHMSFESPKWVTYLLAVCGMLSGEGPPLFWVALHRKHHKFSDLEGDPHSPKDGFWWSHWLWIFPKQNKVTLGALYKKWVPDMVKDPFYQFLEKTYFFWHLGLLALIGILGFLYGGKEMMMSFIAWGFFFRMIWVLHATWMVNSVSHVWGYKNYKTTDDSRNNPLVAILAHGEGWHNNHHHVQAAVNHGQRFWEFDLSFILILTVAILSWPLSWIGLGHLRPVYRLKYYSRKQGKFITWFPSKKKN